MSKKDLEKEITQAFEQPVRIKKIRKEVEKKEKRKLKKKKK